MQLLDHDQFLGATPFPGEHDDICEEQNLNIHFHLVSFINQFDRFTFQETSLFSLF